MTADPLTAINTRATPQSVQADPRQVPNSAGGFTFQIDDEARLRRFLVLGSEGGTYYSGERELTADNAKLVLHMARTNSLAVVQAVVDISVGGRAPKQNPAIFALAVVAGLGDDEGRKAALGAVPTVCRTGTHLFLFARYVEQFRGWGRGLRNAVAGWYLNKPVDEAAYQIVKYRQREGWSHRDLLRLAHPEQPAERVHPEYIAPGDEVTLRTGLTGPRVRGTVRGVTVSGEEPQREWTFDIYGVDEPVIVPEQRPETDPSRPTRVSVSRVTPDHARRALFDWACGQEPSSMVPPLVSAFLEAQSAPVRELIGLIDAHPLSWEMLPDAALNEPDVWEALLTKGMPQTALMRQLPRLTRLGVLSPMGSVMRDLVCRQLTDPERLRKARVHPVNVLVAMKTYAAGHSLRGDSTWHPVPQIIDALDAAFYAAYGAVEPANKRTLLALDVSGSMTSPVAGLPLSCREASAAIALVTAATEPQHAIVGFTAAAGSSGWGGAAALTPLGISPRQRLTDAVQAIANLPFGGTDCSLPMTWANQHGVEVDTFITLTDNETWHGGVHPHQALTAYRRASGIDAKSIVCAMTSTGFSIADPSDPGSLDVTGLDSSVPTLMADFSRGL